MFSNNNAKLCMSYSVTIYMFKVLYQLFTLWYLKFCVDSYTFCHSLTKPPKKEYICTIFISFDNALKSAQGASGISKHNLWKHNSNVMQCNHGV